MSSVSKYLEGLDYPLGNLWRNLQGNVGTTTPDCLRGKALTITFIRCAFASFCALSRCATCSMQVGFGSGFKCNSAIWKALRPVRDLHPAWDHRSNGKGADPEFLTAMKIDS